MGFHTIFSASLISDYKGDEYQRIEYTPYGETWVEKTNNTGLEWLPYKFTAKEIDKETGLYYYGARYLDPKYSKWISTDPALGEYIPKAPIDDDAKKYNQNLPGMGGVFNHINGNLYAYAGNNPVKYTDPDGRKIIHTHYLAFQNLNPNKLVPMGKTPSGVYDPETKEVIKQNTIGDYGCLFTSSMNIANDIKRRYCEKGAVGMPKNVIIPATSIAEMANSDKYFIYNDDPEKNESNADMGIENVKKLIEDVSSCSISIEIITGAENIKKAIATLNSSESDNGYIIGHVKGHFFNLTGTDKKMGYLYHDPYVRSNAAADRLKERINNSMDKIYIIRVIGNE